MPFSNSVSSGITLRHSIKGPEDGHLQIEGKLKFTRPVNGRSMYGCICDLRRIVTQGVRYWEEISTAVAGPPRCENLCAGTADEVFWGLPTMSARRRPTATSGCAKQEMF